MIWNLILGWWQYGVGVVLAAFLIFLLVTYLEERVAESGGGYHAILISPWKSSMVGVLAFALIGAAFFGIAKAVLAYRVTLVDAIGVLLVVGGLSILLFLAVCTGHTLIKIRKRTYFKLMSRLG